VIENTRLSDDVTCFDIAGVASSILATPTINPASSASWLGFSLPRWLPA
jgi:hypothetical protein